ncbi:MAG: DUF928 domain-containing protein [Geitlerinemataceae cyanobacterium]
MNVTYKFFSSIALSAIAIFGHYNGSRAIPIISLETSSVDWEFVPPNDGAPDDRGDAGSRTSCPSSDRSFQALIPATNIGLTLSEFPLFWLYLPYPVSSPYTVGFILRDETTKDEIYHTEFQIDRGEGIVSFRLPEDAPPLEKGRKYRWRFDFFCNDDTGDFVSDNGVILRTAIESEVPTSIADKIEVYARNGIWHELLTELIQLRCVNPEDPDIVAEWRKLLQHPVVRLEDFVSEPILERCGTDL